MPKAAAIAVLVDPGNPRADIQLDDVGVAAAKLGRQYRVLKAASADEIDAAFSALSQRKEGALLIAGAPIFSARRDQLVALAAPPQHSHDLP